MNDQPDPDDVDDDERALLAELAGALPADPLPDGLIERASGLISWFGIDDELASLLDRTSGELAGTRGDAPATAIGTFATDDGQFEFDLGLEAAGDQRTLVGFVPRGEITTVLVLDSAGADVARADVDEFGRVEIDIAPGLLGPHRLRLLAPHRTVVTDWFVL